MTGLASDPSKTRRVGKNGKVDTDASGQKYIQEVLKQSGTTGY